MVSSFFSRRVGPGRLRSPSTTMCLVVRRLSPLFFSTPGKPSLLISFFVSAQVFPYPRASLFERHWRPVQSRAKRVPSPYEHARDISFPPSWRWIFLSPTRVPSRLNEPSCYFPFPWPLTCTSVPASHVELMEGGLPPPFHLESFTERGRPISPPDRRQLTPNWASSMSTKTSLPSVDSVEPFLPCFPSKRRFPGPKPFVSKRLLLTDTLPSFGIPCKRPPRRALPVPGLFLRKESLPLC